MFKKSKFLILLPILLLVTLVTGGFSYYLFNTSSNVTSLDNVGTGSTTNESRNDKIYENYSFSDTGSGNEYTFYFFPSTLYLELYNQGYTQPEEVFGYNELVFDDNGNPQVNAEEEPVYEVVKDTDTNTLNLKQYTISYVENSAESNGDWLNPNYVWSNDLSIIRTTQPFYLPEYDEKVTIGSNTVYLLPGESQKKATSGAVRYGYTYSESGSISLSNTTYYSLLHNHLNGNSGYYYQEDNVGIDLTDNRYTTQNGKGDAEVLSPTANTNDKYDLELTPFSDEEIYMGRRQYRNDRLGFWPTFYDQDDPNNSGSDFTGQGSRYLPIKITVSGNLTADLYDFAIPTPLTSTYIDTSEGNDYFNYFFSLRTYTSTNQNDLPYHTAIEGLYGKSQTNIFDIMRNPSLYSVEEKDENGKTINVIRLYPYFSRGNGKAIGEGSGKDNILAQYHYNETFAGENRMDSLISETPFNYSTETLHYTNGGNTLNYAILSDIYLEEDKYESIIFKVNTANSEEDSLHNTYNVTSHSLSAKALNTIVKDFGEGKYTFYMFVRNAGSKWSDTYIGSEANGNIGEMLVGNQGNDIFNDQIKYFPSLYKKNLFYVNIVNGNDGDYSDTYSQGTVNENDEIDGGFTKNGGSDKIIYNESTGNHGDHPRWGNPDYNYRPVLLMFEKVSNFKVVEDIPFPELTEKENEKNSYTGVFSWDDVDSAISTIYDHSKNMILANGVYEIDGETFKEENFKLSGQTNLSIENPFIYVIQNCDFRYVDSLFFQIRVGNDYIRQAINIVTNFDDSKGHQYLAYQSGRDSNNNPIYSYFASQNALFNKNEDEFFIQSADVTDNKEQITRNGLKLKDNYARGVYDLMLVPTGRPDPDKPLDCNLYIYRHRVDFIKIMDKEPGLTNVDANGNSLGGDFVNHYGAGTDPAKTLWEASFYIGDTFSSESTNDAKVSVLNMLATYAQKNNKTSFALKDSVTDEAIAYYKNGTLYGPSGNSSNGDVELFTILKNYVLYVE